MLLLILIVNIKLKEVFQIDFGKIILIKLLEIVNWYQRGLASMAYKIFDKKTIDRMSVNEQSRELQKAVIKNVRKRTVNASC